MRLPRPAPRAQGRGYSVNVPLSEGLEDDQFHSLFKPIIRRVMEVFAPGAVVLQCGEGGLALGGLGRTGGGAGRAGPGAGGPGRGKRRCRG